ncbi:hypothetical Protein YC6258_04633 [Gynuella sunshinyii YC6258]|uniref:Uncharacterized protein n=1 Tax=Gynuella sunshinyii YC6258 TaxID=1445510 RepID=A0A0C5VBE0_9GAMM|nr:hypothetical Protein YC6258_04633 [Gynuella sunshinyii YC6258]
MLSFRQHFIHSFLILRKFNYVWHCWPIGQLTMVTRSNSSIVNRLK